MAVDLEAAGFHRYSDRVCLLQVTSGNQNFIVDTLAVDPSDVLRGPLESPTVTVLLHGGDYDLRLLDRDLDLHPVTLFDTQTAAALLGEPSLGLAALLKKYLDVHVSKKYQRADWAKRPLPDEMLDYAASDTRHLHQLADLLTERLDTLGRRSWAEEESALMETLRWHSDGEIDPVTKIKGVRKFELRDVALIREAWLWRDEIARARDRAPFRVAGDPAIRRSYESGHGTFRPSPAYTASRPSSRSGRGESYSTDSNGPTGSTIPNSWVIQAGPRARAAPHLRWRRSPTASRLFETKRRRPWGSRGES